MQLKAGILFACALAVLAAGSLWADLAPPQPSLIAGGFASADGSWGYFAGASATVEAVDLGTGKQAWSTAKGAWPLCSGWAWVAVAKPDPEDPKAIRIAFLQPKDGTVISESGAIRLADWVGARGRGIADERGFSMGGRDATLEVDAWTLPARRGPGPVHAGWMCLHWQAQERVPASGIRPSSIEGMRHAEGLFYVDPSSGKVEPGSLKKEAPRRPQKARLPKVWKPAAGALAPGEEFVPLLSLDGSYLVLSHYRDTKDRRELYDLRRPGQAAPVALPDFEEGWHFNFSVSGPTLYYVAESRVGDASGGTDILRRLVALDWAKGKIRWTYPLAGLHEDPPVAGGGLR
jgi:hypothetical protein